MIKLIPILGPMKCKYYGPNDPIPTLQEMAEEFAKAITYKETTK